MSELSLFIVLIISFLAIVIISWSSKSPATPSSISSQYKKIFLVSKISNGILEEPSWFFYNEESAIDYRDWANQMVNNSNIKFKVSSVFEGQYL